MQAILGVIFHFIGGFASGSFYMPYKKVRQWHWESYWIIGGLFSWLIVPPLAAALTVPGFWDIIKATPASVIKPTVKVVFVFLLPALHSFNTMPHPLATNIIKAICRIQLLAPLPNLLSPIP